MCVPVDGDPWSRWRPIVPPASVAPSAPEDAVPERIVSGQRPPEKGEPGEDAENGRQPEAGPRVEHGRNVLVGVVEDGEGLADRVARDGAPSPTSDVKVTDSPPRGVNRMTGKCMIEGLREPWEPEYRFDLTSTTTPSARSRYGRRASFRASSGTKMTRRPTPARAKPIIITATKTAITSPADFPRSAPGEILSALCLAGPRVRRQFARATRTSRTCLWQRTQLMVMSR